MKLKKAKIIVEPLKEVERRWKEALRGSLRSRSNEEVISVGSWEILGRVFSAARLQILSYIPRFKPHSIAQLARGLGKNFKNVYSDVKFLAELGLIELKEEGPRRTLIPLAKFREIDLPLAA